MFQYISDVRKTKVVVMDQQHIVYQQKTAAVSDIYRHLDACKDQFYPRLGERVNIREYSEKLFEKSVTFEAWSGTLLVALVAVYFNDPHNRTAYITSASTLGQYAGQGIASALLRECIAYAEAHHFQEIHLEVHRDNIAAIGLYRKFGFEDVKKEDNALFMKRRVIID